MPAEAVEDPETPPLPTMARPVPFCVILRICVVLLPVTVCAAVKVLAEASFGISAALTCKLSVPLVPPPVSTLLPAVVTPVIVPAPLGVAHAQAVPFHSNTWPLAQLVSRPRFSVPLVPPPVRPLPLAVVTPVSPPPNTMSSSGA